jgi:hypothetical protein
MRFLKITIPVDEAKFAKMAGHKDVPLKEAAQVAKGLASIATNAWKVKTKMLDNNSGAVREDMKRVYRHVESILESLQEMGVEIKDHTDDAFDYGLPLKVITTQPMPGITKEKVIETIKPTVFWQKQIIQMGEVVVATPQSPQEKS